MQRRHSFTERLELSCDLMPGVPLDYERSSGFAEFVSSRFVVQETDHSCSKIIGIVGGDEFFLVSQRQPLCADCRRHDRLGHAECLKNFHARPAACSQRHHVDGRLIEIRPYVINSPGHDHPETLGRIAQFLRGITTDNRERRVRNLLADFRKNRLAEINDGIFVRVPIHRAAEHEARRNFRPASGREIRCIDTGRNRPCFRTGRHLGEARAIFLRYRNGQIGAAAELGLFIADLAPLDFEKQFLDRIALERAETLPDQVLDVVLEQHNRDISTERHIRGRKQKIADDDVDVIFVDERRDGLADFFDAPLPQVDWIGREP